MRTPGTGATAQNATPTATGSASDAGDYVVPNDVLLREPPLPYRSELVVLGITVELATNSQRVLTVARGAFEPVERSDPRMQEGTASAGTPHPTLRVQVVIYPGRADATAAPIRHICPDPVRVLILGSDGMGIVDPLRHEALIYAAVGVVHDEARLRQGFLEPAILALVTHFDRHPVHAAAIAGHARTVLLIGPSGAGKSTLAYLAHTAGFTVLGEDTIWLQRSPELAIWGQPREVHLLPDAGRSFPDLKHAQPTRQRNGKLKAVLPLREGTTVRTAATHTIVVCILQPGGAAADLTRIGRDELSATLAQPREPGFDRYHERWMECVRALAASEGWRLTLSANPSDALPLLRRLVHGSDR